MSYNENSFTLYRNTTLTNTVSRFQYQNDFNNHYNNFWGTY